MNQILGEKYPTYEEREDAKREGWHEIRNSDSVQKKAWYFLNRIIWAHYWRAREDVEQKKNKRSFLRAIRGKKYYPLYTLDIDHYTQHWLWANQESVSPEVMKAIKEIYFYEPEENKFLPKGYTQYQLHAK